MSQIFASRIQRLGIIFSVIGFMVMVQMGRVQASPSGKALRDIADQTIINQIVDVFPERGNIYDRYGRLLAGNHERYEVGLNLRDITDPETVARTLSGVLEWDYNELLRFAQAEFIPGKQEYIRLSASVSPEVVNELQQISKELKSRPVRKFLWFREYPPSIRGVEWKPRLERVYPESTVGSNILGIYHFRNVDNPSASGGLEEKYDLQMAGKPVKIHVSYDPNDTSETPTIPPGDSLVLTIDREIQAKMEEIIDRGVESAGAETGVLVALEPSTGEVIAMATTPRIDPNEYWRPEYREKGAFFPEDTPLNPAISELYEPGSVFKVLTMASAFDNGTVTPDTVFTDTGQIMVGSAYIYNWDRRGYGPVTMKECMQYSLNVCLAWVATQMTAGNFYDYMNAFNVGRSSKIDLAGEAYYPLSVPGDSRWTEENLGANSFGQGVAVTPLQLAASISALANDGVIMSPHVVRSSYENGGLRDRPLTIVGNPIRKETAQIISGVLAESLELEASSALVEGYRMAGKTGTAEIPTKDGYTSSETNASFVGWGPLDDPRFLVYIWLKKPTTAPWGSVVAAPVFSEAAKALTVYLNIPPDDIRVQLLGP